MRFSLRDTFGQIGRKHDFRYLEYCNSALYDVMHQKKVYGLFSGMEWLGGSHLILGSGSDFRAIAHGKAVLRTEF